MSWSTIKRHEQTRAERMSASLNKAAQEYIVNHESLSRESRFMKVMDLVAEICEFLTIEAESEDRGNRNRYYEIPSASSTSGNPVQLEWFQPVTGLFIDGNAMQWWEGFEETDVFSAATAASLANPDSKVELLARCYSGDFLLTIEEVQS